MLFEIDLYQDDDTLEDPVWINIDEYDLVAIPVSGFLEDLSQCAYDCLECRHCISENLDNVYLAPTEPVSVVGYPLHSKVNWVEPVWLTGYMASEITYRHEGQPVFLIDARTRESLSGAPVLAFRYGGYRNKVGTQILGPTTYWLLGVYSGRVHEDADIGMVWNCKALVETVERADYLANMKKS